MHQIIKLNSKYEISIHVFNCFISLLSRHLFSKIDSKKILKNSQIITLYFIAFSTQNIDAAQSIK